MQAQGVLFGQITAVFGIVIAGVWSATQWTAAALGYQVRLGSPWFDLFGTPVYHPGGCSSGGSSSMPMRRMSSTSVGPSLAAVVWWPWPSPSPCRCGARGNRAWSRPTVRHAGRLTRKSSTPV